MTRTTQYARGGRPAPTQHMRRRTLTALVVVAAFGLPATAAALDDPDPGVVAKGTPAAEAVDIAIIAKDRGWSLDATRRHMVNQDAFGALQDRIEAQFPTIAGAELAETPGGKSYLRFKGAVPAAARTQATASGLNVELTGGRTYSTTELESRSTAVVKFFADAGYQRIGAAVLPSGQIEVAVTGVARPGVNLPPALSNEVRVTYVSQDVAGELHNYGGAYVHGATTGCTSGFTVEDQLTGATGLTTAGHCSGINHYHQPQNGPAYDLFPVVAEHIGSDGDVQWHTTPTHLDLAEYYAAPIDLRQVNSVETSAAVNNTYCVYSRVQGTRTCDQVFSTIAVTWVSGGLASDLVAMDDMNAVAGDSGGPWSYSTEAAGTVVGWFWLPFGNHDTWSKAWLFDSAIDVEVLT